MGFLLLVAASTTVLAQDSFTARIPVLIAARNYAGAEELIAQAVRTGAMSSGMAAAYRENIKRQQQEQAAPSQQEEKGPQGETEPKKKPGEDWPPPPYKPGRATRGRIYVTYTKLNRQTKRIYSGRTSMLADFRQSLDAQAVEAVRLRDSHHHVDEGDEPKSAAFDPAQVDEFDVGVAIDYNERYGDLAYWRIRGREQQLIDLHGGAQSDTGKPYRTENVVRGVAKSNQLGRQFDEAATAHWGRIYRYTGDE